MKYFSVPADFKKATIDRYDEINSKNNYSSVIETYGNITRSNFFGSGRSVEHLPGINLEDLAEYVAYSKQKGIDFNYTLNAASLQNREFTKKGILEIMSFLNNLYEIGVYSLTISLPSVLEIVRASKYEFKVKASVICEINNASKAQIYKDMGVERIVTEESINRDFYQLKRILNIFKDKVEVIINSICHKNCVYRMFHYNQISNDSIHLSSKASVDYYNHRCLLRRYENIGNLLKLTWIRPEDLGYYTGIGIKYFKIQGRHTVMNGDPARAVECYINESYEGDLLELLDIFNPTSHFRVRLNNKSLDGFILPFTQTENFCKNDCLNCNYCDSFAERCVDKGEVNSIHESANEFLMHYDEFRNILESIIQKKSSRKSVSALDADFKLN